MEAITYLVMAVFIIVGFVHIYWALGGTLYIDFAIPTIEGKPLFTPPNWLTFLVAVALFVLAFLAYGLHFFDMATYPYATPHIYLARVVGGFFIIRAIGDFRSVGFFKRVKSSGFARNDTRVYSPLFLFLGLYFIVVSY